MGNLGEQHTVTAGKPEAGNDRAVGRAAAD